MADSRRAPSGRPGSGGSSKRGPSGRSSRESPTSSSARRSRSRSAGEDELKQYVTTRQVRASVEHRSAGSGSASRSGRARYSLTSRAALLALVVVVLLVSYAYPLRSWLDQQSERKSLQAEAEQLRKENARLEAELELWDDPTYIEAQARERLGFVMPGEDGYIVVPDESTAADTGADELPQGVPPASTGAWYERLWGSVKAADAVRPPTDE